MAYAWAWQGGATLLGAVLLVATAVLFLRARRTEFSVSFAAYTATSGVQKGAAGVAIYLATDPGTALPWFTFAVWTWFAILPPFVQAFVAFATRRDALPWSWRVAIWAPFVALAGVCLVRPGLILQLGVRELFAAFILANFPFLAYAWRALRRAQTVIEREEARYLLLYLAVTTPIVAESYVIYEVLGRLPLWEIALAYAVGTTLMLYGILRHAVFDIDVLVKRTTFYSMVTAGVAVAFVLVEQVVASSVAVPLPGGVVGGVGAALLLMPLAYGARRVVERAFPGVATEAALERRREHVYRAHLELALADGVVSDGEAALLAKARRELGIGPEVHARIQAELLARAPGTGGSAPVTLI